MTGASRAPCPICRKPAVADYRPFCSKRCADVDLQRWFSGAYAVPAVEADEAPDDDEGS
ncbi:MAG: DNA gyrase inhibitor YacG [Pseudomonadota bacterium]|jgi:endogenous inhibitor of DNA gyrase (YacG/DUF329 family)|nr:DNA gyrase inhibitor YacG [Caulobacteraceae bacterium]